MMKDVMLDLETMGNGPNAAIIAIGAVEFDIPSRALGETFYTTVDLESSVAAGGVMDASTVLWWMKQGNAARAEFSQDGTPIHFALQAFSNWMLGRGAKGEVRVWGNGAAFDNVILSSAYKRNCVITPWEFWNDRCYRTVKALHPNVKLERIGTYHNALADATNQARHLIAMLNP